MKVNERFLIMYVYLYNWRKKTQRGLCNLFLIQFSSSYFFFSFLYELWQSLQAKSNQQKSK